jgi:branched-chain amino acid transport system substrate-binding protein
MSNKRHTCIVLALTCAMGWATAPAGAAELLVGNIISVTGPAAFYGLPMNQAVQLAVEEVNAAGGIKAGGQAYTIKLLTGDDQANPTVGVAALKKMIGDGARYIIGPVVAGVAPALKPIIESNSSVTLIVDGTTAENIPNGKNIFRHQALVESYNAGVVELVKARGYKTVALVTDRFHSGLMNSEKWLVDTLDTQGIKIAAKEYYKLNDTDFSAQLTNVNAKAPAAIVLRGWPNETALATKQLRQLGYKGQIVWDAPAPPDTVRKNISNAEMEGVVNIYVPTIDEYVKAKNPAAMRLAEAFKKKFGTEAGLLSPLSYDAVYLLKAAIEKAGSIDNAKVNAALASMKMSEIPGMINDFRPRAGGMLYDNTGQVDLPAKAYVWKGGDWTPLAPTGK